MKRRPLREESLRCSPSVVCADSFETRPAIYLIMGVGLHSGHIEKHTARCRTIAFSLIPTVHTVSHSLWTELRPDKSWIVFRPDVVQFDPVSDDYTMTAGEPMASNILPSQIAREKVDAKDRNEMAYILREFGKSVVALCEVMDQGRSLTDMKLLFIENHFQVIQMAYLRWKRKHTILPVDTA